MPRNTNRLHGSFTFRQFIRKPNDRNRVISTDKAVLHFSKVCSYRRKSSRKNGTIVSPPDHHAFHCFCFSVKKRGAFAGAKRESGIH